MVLVSGCSFRFVYNHLDWWTNWYLDDYVTLNTQQQKFFDDEFEKLHLWHRKTQLPLYSQQLKALKLAISGTINEQQVTDNFAKFVEHWQSFLIATEPKLQPLAFSFTEQQKQQLVNALKAQNQERLDDHEALTDQQWFEERAEDQQEQLKEWFGKLTKAQKQQVVVMSQGFQRSFRPWINYRQRWTDQFSMLLNGNLPEHQFKFEFYRLFVNARSLRSEEFNAISTDNNQVFAKIFVYMVTNATDKQRKRINKKLDKVIGDLAYLTNAE
jgi:hypothetical protein